MTSTLTLVGGWVKRAAAAGAFCSAVLLLNRHRAYLSGNAMVLFSNESVLRSTLFALGSKVGSQSIEDQPSPPHPQQPPRDPHPQQP